MTYYYEPGNFAGSHRMQSWVNNLPKFGIHPVVITRHWNENETDFTGLSRENEVKITEFNTSTVIRLPFKGSLRDRLISKFGNKIKGIGKIFSLFQLLAQNFRIKSSPQHNLYYYTKDYLIKNPNIKVVLASGKPFILFKYCHDLKKHLEHINWIADYRDPWNSETINNSLQSKIFRSVEKKMEKKWLNNASFISTVSQGVSDGILKVLGYTKPVIIVKNGFEKFYESECSGNNNKITIAYLGTLYDEQNIEIFLEGLTKFIDRYNSVSNIGLNFYGLADQKIQASRVEKLLTAKISYRFYPLLPKELVMDKICKDDYLLLCGIPQRKGTYTAKFMDYLALKKPIILCPSDHDVLEKAINRTSTGFVVNTSDEVLEKLKEFADNRRQKETIKYIGNLEEIEKFKIENQVKVLAETIKRISG